MVSRRTVIQTEDNPGVTGDNPGVTGDNPGVTGEITLGVETPCLA